MHVAFRADSEAMAQAFYDAALKAGGTDNGPPRPRDQFGYYGAFVLDPDGNNIEAVYRSGPQLIRPDSIAGALVKDAPRWPPEIRPMRPLSIEMSRPQITISAAPVPFAIRACGMAVDGHVIGYLTEVLTDQICGYHSSLVWLAGSNQRPRCA